MRRGDVQGLHYAIEDTWDAWVQEATTSGIEGWENDTFLQESAPISIAVRYGQNLPACQEDQEQRTEEASHWQRIHTYCHMQTMTLAIETHIQ